MILPTSFGQWLKQRRRALDLTQNELAEQIGCAEETLRKLEADARRPSKQIAQRLADVLFTDGDERHRFVQRARGLPPDDPAPSATRHNLPAQLTSFIGREREVAEVAAALATSRLVTLTGVGGSGKTRLALEVAGTLRDDYPGGVWVIELAPLADPALVPHAVTAALGLREEPGRPLLATLTAALQAAPTLLILDNCEHLITACAQLGATLLHACPQLRILVTSREVLGILGETIYLVPALATPDPQHLPPVAEVGQIAAVRLFVERAQAVQRQFGLTEQNAASIAAICQRLDGLPLAIELAAVRIRTMPVVELAGRLGQRFHLLTTGSRTALPRHQTLHALIEWSYGLLMPDEQRLFGRLAVFAGGWTLEAAEAVCSGDGLAADDVLDLLCHLVDKSLVLVETHGESVRYTLHETIRQYALERLERSGEAEVLRRRHAHFFLDLAETAEPMLMTAQRDVWLERLAGEHDNLRAALAWSQGAADGLEIGLRLAGALWIYWYYRGQVSEGRGWLEGILTRSEIQRAAGEIGEDSQRATRPLARALVAAGALAYLQADFRLARVRQEASERLSRQLEDRPGLAMSMITKGMLALVQGDVSAARSFTEQGVELARESGGAWLLAFGLWRLGCMYQSQGQIAQARTVFEEALPLFRAIKEEVGLSIVSSELGWIAYQQRDYAMAHAYFRDSLSVRAQQRKLPVAMCLEHLAAVAGAQGQLERVAMLLGAADALRTAVGIPALITDIAPYEPALKAARVQLGETGFTAAWAEGRAMTLEEAVAYALKGE